MPGESGRPANSDQRTCASCSKTGEGLKKCTACKSVWYCDVSCQKAHRKDHRKECKRWENELKDTSATAADLAKIAIAHEDTANAEDPDDDIWNPPPRPECTICMLAMPVSDNLETYMPCCGNKICGGCILENDRVITETNERNARHSGRKMIEVSCPFCREKTDGNGNVFLAQLKKRMEMNDAEAFFTMSGMYFCGQRGLPKDECKGLEHLLRAAELGSIDACYNISNCFLVGKHGAERNAKKHRKYLELAVKGGHVIARHNLGTLESRRFHTKLAMRHWLISAAAGFQMSLDMIKDGYKVGLVTKDEFAETLRAFQAARDEEKSEERDRAKQVAS